MALSVFLDIKVCLGAFIFFGSFADLGCGQPSVTDQITAPISISPRVLRLGTVKHGNSAEGTFVIHNATTSEERLSSFESSCPCVSFTGDSLPFSIGPGESRNWSVLFDPRSEPEFNGRLAVKLTWADNRGLFNVQATVEVDVQ